MKQEDKDIFEKLKDGGVETPYGTRIIQDSRGNLHEIGNPKMEALDKALHLARKLEAIGAMISDIFCCGDNNEMMALHSQGVADIIIDDARAIEVVIENEDFSCAPEVIGQVFNLAGKLKAVGFIIQDISSRKDGNQVLKHYGETMADIIFDYAQAVHETLIENRSSLIHLDDQKSTTTDENIKGPLPNELQQERALAEVVAQAKAREDAGQQPESEITVTQ